MVTILQAVAITIPVVILVTSFGIYTLACDYILFCFLMPPAGDYGDARDGTESGYPVGYAQIANFPTSPNHDGAYVTTTNVVWLGKNSGSTERGTYDRIDPDGRPNLPRNTVQYAWDSDDNLEPEFFCITINKYLPFQRDCEYVVEVNSSVDGIYYLNMLVDLNKDGKWSSTNLENSEWVIKNREVQVSPSRPSYESIPNYASLEETWMRITVTAQPIDQSNWDGSGFLGTGEIEDHFMIIIDNEDDECQFIVCTHNDPFSVTRP